MSSSPSGADGSQEPPHIRIGNDERAAAMQALDEHLSAGRLEPDEYGDRVAKVSVARTRDDLEELFVDLPEPRPFSGTLLAATRQAPAPPPRSPEPSGADRDDGALGGRAGAVLVALAPIIALALFFATRWWVWFLLVPAVAVAVYGGRNERRRGR